MTMYARSVGPHTYLFANDIGQEFHLDNRTHVLPLWVAQNTHFASLWANELVQVDTTNDFASPVTSIPTSELPSTGTTVEGVSDVPGLQAALDAKVNGVGITDVVGITQTAYNALSPKIATTYYVITGP